MDRYFVGSVSREVLSPTVLPCRGRPASTIGLKGAGHAGSAHRQLALFVCCVRQDGP